MTDSRISPDRYFRRPPDRRLWATIQAIAQGALGCVVPTRSAADQINDEALITRLVPGICGVFRARGQAPAYIIFGMPSVPVEFDDKIRSARGHGSHIGRVEMMFIPVANPSEDRGWPEDVDAAKALFMTGVACIVEEGRGELARLQSGTLELRLATGEIYQLGEQSITRIV